MDLWDLTRLLLRRWYFAAPMLLASVAVVVMAAQTVSPDYKSTGYMQLIPAPSTGKAQDPKAKQRPANPWNDLGYAALGNAAAITITDQTSLDRLVGEGYTDSVTVVMNESTPLFEIEAVGNSKEQATGTVREIIKLLQADISAKQRQYGTLPEDTISTLVINDGSSPQLESGKVKRVLIVAAGLGLLLTTAATIALDYWLRRRARRRSEEDSADEAVAPAERGQADQLEPGDRTRVFRPTKIEPPQPSTHAAGNVYSGDRRKSEPKAHASVRPANGTVQAPPDTPVDATIVIPMPHQARRSQDKRP